MRTNFLGRLMIRRSVFGAWVGLFLMLQVAAVPAKASAQAGSSRTWALVPMLGFGVLRDGGSWGSAGAEAALDIQYGGTRWRWNAYGFIQGVGVGCSSADLQPGATASGCFDGGPGVAIGGARSVGPFWVGGGVGATNQHDPWRLRPFVRVSLDARPFRFDLRADVSRGTGSRLYLPLLVGIPLSK